MPLYLQPYHKGTSEEVHYAPPYTHSTIPLQKKFPTSPTVRLQQKLVLTGLQSKDAMLSPMHNIMLLQQNYPKGIRKETNTNKTKKGKWKERKKEEEKMGERDRGRGRRGRGRTKGTKGREEGEETERGKASEERREAR
ncbi:hypothetical protein RCL_jg10121.t1 [Rhizophagus clarus]|nr:hypothetical protein RCL_jg10121.t1 [Rhizophagus clarus]